ncbi:hypothetical protein HDU98_011359 [Podochytrium sp. JEL0797]|nr:hypothetical protein HDU98_011359 [Podochytrium sp. JEL0797]
MLDLKYNRLTGEIPVEVWGLTQLKWLNLSSNEGLSGSIPDELGELGLLEELDLSGASLSGWTPHSIGKLARLKRLDLSLNKLSGGIPVELGELEDSCGVGEAGSVVDSWFLNCNVLSGEVPVEELSGLE